MAQYFFRIRNGPFAGDSEIDLADNGAAWVELTRVSGDMLGSIARNLKQNAEWQIELLDKTKKPLFRISLMAETLD